MSTDIPVVVTAQGVFRADYLEEKKQEAKRLFEKTKEQRQKQAFDNEQMTRRLVDNMRIDTKMDSAQTNMVARSLIYTLRELKRITKREAADILEQAVTVNREGGAGIRSINYQELDLSGEFRAIANSGTDLPEVGSTLSETPQRVQTYGAAMGWSQQDLEAAEFASRNGGRPVDLGARKRMAVMRAAVKKKNDILFNGDATYGLKGFFDYTLNQVAIGGGWSSAIADDKLADVLALANAAETDTEDFVSDTIIMDTASYSDMNQPRGSTDTSIARYVMNNTTIRAILKTSRLDSVTNALNSLSSDRVMMAYPNNPEVLEYMLPRDYEFFPVQVHGVMYMVPVLMDIAGLFAYKYGSGGPITIATGM